MPQCPLTAWRGLVSNGRTTTSTTNPSSNRPPVVESLEASRFLAIDSALPDGDVIVTGNPARGAPRFRMTRYNADGTPDTAFGGGDGTVIAPAPGGSRVARHQGGRIVVLGSAAWSLTGYTPNGRPDPRFFRSRTLFDTPTRTAMALGL